MSSNIFNRLRWLSISVNRSFSLPTPVDFNFSLSSFFNNAILSATSAVKLSKRFFLSAVSTKVVPSTSLSTLRAKA